MHPFAYLPLIEEYLIPDVYSPTCGLALRPHGQLRRGECLNTPCSCVCRPVAGEFYPNRLGPTNAKIGPAPAGHGLLAIAEESERDSGVNVRNVRDEGEQDFGLKTQRSPPGRRRSSLDRGMVFTMSPE
jgi:hypothetical protein